MLGCTVPECERGNSLLPVDIATITWWIKLYNKYIQFLSSIVAALEGIIPGPKVVWKGTR